MIDVFVARQPIFRPDSSVYGYELLARTGMESVFGGLDASHATAQAIQGELTSFSMERLSRDKPIFVNFGRELLVSDHWQLLPWNAVVEVLEDVEPDDEVLEACRRLQRAGYRLALDDLESVDRHVAFRQMPDILKVDFRTASMEQRAGLPRSAQKLVRIPTLIAEKVEDRAAFEEAMALGYQYVQGFYFARPETVQGRTLPSAKLHILHLLQEVQSPDFDYRVIEEIVRRDAGLSFKMLRFVNSAAIGLRTPVRSLRQALTLLGRERITRLATLLALTAPGVDRSEELGIRSVVRAHFCESLSRRAGLPEDELDLFMLGMFSTFDALLGVPASDVADLLPVGDDVKRALLGQPGRLRDALDLVQAYETGDWARVSTLAQRLAILEQQLPALYLAAVEVGDSVFAAEGAALAESA